MQRAWEEDVEHRSIRTIFGEAAGGDRSCSNNAQGFAGTRDASPQPDRDEVEVFQP
jgi:hypothetical protein